MYIFIIKPLCFLCDSELSVHVLKNVLFAISWLNLFFVFRTVRIWNTENPKKNKTVIKTKNKQGKIIYVALTPVCRSMVRCYL